MEATSLGLDLERALEELSRNVAIIPTDHRADFR